MPHGGIMLYRYEDLKPKLFTEAGRKALEETRVVVASLLMSRSRCTLDEVLTNSHMVGDSWLPIACVDRMVELGELHEMPTPTRQTGQERQFMRPEWHQDMDSAAARRFHWQQLYYLSSPDFQKRLLEIQNRD